MAKYSGMGPLVIMVYDNSVSQNFLDNDGDHCHHDLLLERRYLEQKIDKKLQPVTAGRTLVLFQVHLVLIEDLNTFLFI